MNNKNNMNEIQNAIMLLHKFCRNHKTCEFKKCPLYKYNYGCIINIPFDWDIGELSIIDFDRKE